jgi:hypothetical protein
MKRRGKTIIQLVSTDDEVKYVTNTGTALLFASDVKLSECLKHNHYIRSRRIWGYEDLILGEIFMNLKFAL